MLSRRVPEANLGHLRTAQTSDTLWSDLSFDLLGMTVPHSPKDHRKTPHPYDNVNKLGHKLHDLQFLSNLSILNKMYHFAKTKAYLTLNSFCTFGLGGSLHNSILLMSNGYVNFAVSWEFMQVWMCILTTLLMELCYAMRPIWVFDKNVSSVIFYLRNFSTTLLRNCVDVLMIC